VSYSGTFVFPSFPKWDRQPSGSALLLILIPNCHPPSKDQNGRWVLQKLVNYSKVFFFFFGALYLNAPPHTESSFCQLTTQDSFHQLTSTMLLSVYERFQLNAHQPSSPQFEFKFFWCLWPFKLEILLCFTLGKACSQGGGEAWNFFPFFGVNFSNNKNDGEKRKKNIGGNEEVINPWV
jgi:hypothetical protein